MRRYLLLGFLLAITAPLWASVTHKTATWDRPTQRVSGDPLPFEEIAGYDLVCYRTGSEEEVYAVVVPREPETHVTDEVFDAGEFQCRMRTIDTEGRTSTWNESNVFSVGRCELVDCTPLPPTNIIVTLP